MKPTNNIECLPRHDTAKSISALKIVVIAFSVIVLSCMATITIASIVKPADTYVYGYQIHLVTESNMNENEDADEYIGHFCIIKATPASMVVEGDIVEYKGADGKPHFVKAKEVTDAYNIVAIRADGTEYQVPKDTVRGVVVEVI